MRLPYRERRYGFRVGTAAGRVDWVDSDGLPCGAHGMAHVAMAGWRVPVHAGCGGVHFGESRGITDTSGGLRCANPPYAGFGLIVRLFERAHLS